MESINDMIAGYLMTGGKNRRMEGKKKLFLEYRGKSFLESILDALQCFEKIYLSVEKEAPYIHLKLPMIVDEISEIGPIGGIYSGLKNTMEDALFVVACDMPFVSKAVIECMLDKYLMNQDKIVIAFADGQEQPLLGIYPKSALPYFEKQIQARDYKLKNVLVNAGYIVIELPVGDCSSVNINTVEEYNQLCKK